MSTRRAPLALVQAAIDVVTRLLPSSAARTRYRAEFTAELHQLGAAAQLAFLPGVLSRVLALRAALRLRPEHAGGGRRPVRRYCILGWHAWERRNTEDGGRYEVCRRCGDDRGPVGFGPLTTPPWPGPR